MPFRVIISTQLPDENDGGFQHAPKYHHMQFDFHNEEKARMFADGNKATIRTCKVVFIEDSPGPFEDA